MGLTMDLPVMVLSNVVDNIDDGGGDTGDDAHNNGGKDVAFGSVDCVQWDNVDTVFVDEESSIFSRHLTDSWCMEQIGSIQQTAVFVEQGNNEYVTRLVRQVNVDDIAEHSDEDNRWFISLVGHLITDL